jgi:hypothetical protein
MSFVVKLRTKLERQSPYFKNNRNYDETILIIYFSIAGICLFSTAFFFIAHFEIEEIDGFRIVTIYFRLYKLSSIINYSKNM